MPAAVGLIIAGLVLILLRRDGKEVPAKRRRIGISCICVGAAVLLTGGYAGSLLMGCYADDMRPLEMTEKIKDLPEGYLIAVASAGYNGDDMAAESHRRLREGYRLAREFEKRRIKWQMVLAFPGSRDKLAGKTVKDYNNFFEIPAVKVMIVQNAANSRQEVEKFTAFSGRLILVSSPYHLPRLLHLAHLYGAEDPLVSATEKIKPDRIFDSVLAVFPSARSFAKFETLIYELLGRLELFVISPFFSAPERQRVLQQAI